MSVAVECSENLTQDETDQIEPHSKSPVAETEYMAMGSVPKDPVHTVTEKAKPSHLSEIQPSLLGNVDCLRFQNHLLEIVEELRIRRATDVENEDKLKQLLGEKHQLENKYEDVQQSLHHLELQESERTATFNKQLHSKMGELNQEKNKLSVACECAEKEVKALKDEVRALQLCKYNLEKKLGEHDKKLQLHSCAQDTQLTQLAALDSVRQMLSQRLSELTQQQDNLQDNVKAAGELNRKLTYVNEHQNCIIRECRADVARLERELVDCRIKLGSQPQEDASKRQLAEQKLTALHNQVEAKQKIIIDLKDRLQHSQQQCKDATQSLQSAQQLVERHVDCSNQRQIQLNAVETHLTAVQAELAQSVEKCEGKDEELQQQKREMEGKLKEWEEKRESMQIKLDSTRSELEKLQTEHSELRESNLHWVQKHCDLTAKFEELQAELNKPRSDAETQVCPDTSDCSVQAQPDMAEGHCQTAAVDVSHIDTQTADTECSENYTQTDVIEAKSVETQTVVVSQENSSPSAASTQPMKDIDPPCQVGPKQSQPVAPQPSQGLDATNPPPTGAGYPLMSEAGHLLVSQADLIPAVAMTTIQLPPSTLQPCAVAMEADQPSSQPVSSQSVLEGSPASPPLSCSQPLPAESIHGDCSKDDTGELSPYSRFTASLKSLASAPKTAAPVDKRNEEPSTKRLKLQTKSAEHSLKNSNPPGRYSFQFVHYSEPPATSVAKTRNSSRKKVNSEGVESKTSLGGKAAVTKPTGILQEHAGQKTSKRNRHVTFSSMVDMSSPPNQQVDYEDVEDVISGDGSLECQDPQTDQACANGADTADIMSGEEPLFSDDESNDIDMGSQVQRIETFLRKDRLRENTKGNSKI